MDAERDNWVCLATVATAHGIRGALKLRCFTERPEDVGQYGPVFDKNGKRLFTLTVLSQVKGGVIARAEGIDDRNAAEALRGLELFVLRSALPEPNDDEFYIRDLEGLTARRVGGERFGTVRRVVNNGAGDLLEIQSDNGEQLWVPFDRTSVPVIDMDQGCLEIADRPEIVVEPQAKAVEAGSES